jgi:hypothetical protein
VYPESPWRIPLTLIASRLHNFSSSASRSVK